MTNTRAQARHVLLHKTRRHPNFHKRGKQKNDIVKLGQGRKFQGQHILQNHRKYTCNMRTGQAQQGYVHEIKSLRVRNRGYYSTYCDDGDGLQQFKAFCGKASSYGDQYNNDDGGDDDSDDVHHDDDDDYDDDDDDAWKYTNAHHDGDWIPKSHDKNWVHDDDDDDNHDDVISGKRAHGFVDCEDHQHHNDYDNDADNDHDNVSCSKQASNGDHTPDAIVDNYYHDNDHEGTHAHESADKGDMLHIDDDDPQPNGVGYIRRRRRSMDSLLKGCNKRNLPIKGSKCSTSLSHLSKQISLWSKEAAFPSWHKKKLRVLCKRQDKASEGLTNVTATQLENGRCDIHVCSKLNAMVQQMQQHADSNNVRTFQTWQHSSPHVTAMLQMQGQPPLQSCPNSPAVSLSTVLEDLPKEFADSEVTASLHGDDACNNQPSNTTDGAKRPSTQQTQEENADDSTEKEKSQALMGKPKRKKHRPKVQRDIFHKAKRMPKNIKNAQEGDVPQTEKQEKVQKKRQAKKGQETCNSTIESSTMAKKKRGRKPRRASPADASNALNDNNQGTKSLYSYTVGNSIIPLPSTLLLDVHDQYRENNSLQNLTVREVGCWHNLLASKDELSMYMHLAEGHLRLTPELINRTQGNTLTLNGHMLALNGQLLGQQVPHFIYENRLPPSKSMKDITLGCNELSLIDSKPDGYTQLLLAQEPHNQLEMVVYNQKREVVVSKSTKSRAKIRAKVQLDAENERMWPRLVWGGVPTDYEDVLYWKRERAIMKKNVNLFIHKMQFVQGDRHFSPWKGSILDSVVGAFLTQNVSDHLSSSAFMSVASHYPSKRRDNTEDTHISDETPSGENECASEDTHISDENPNGENKCASEDTHMSDATPNGENKYALELSKSFCKMKSDTQAMHKKSSASIDEESPKKQENDNVPNLEGSKSTTSTCEITSECIEQIKPCSSLRAFKSILRNTGSSHTKEIIYIAKYSDSINPIRTSINALTDEDSTRQSGMQPPDSTFKEKILMEHSHNSASSLNLTNSTAVDYTGRRSMHHLDTASPHCMEVNVSMEPHDIVSSLDHVNNITVDYTKQSGSENTSFHLLGKEHTTKTLKLSHNGITVDYTSRSGMQNLEKASPQSPQQDTSTRSCINSISDLGHHKIASANHTRQSSMQHLDNASMGLIEEGIANEPSDISTATLSLHDYTGHIGIQHLDRGFCRSMEEDISMKQNDLHGSSIIVKPDLCDGDKEKLCSSLSTEVSCNHELVSSASKTRGLADGSNTNICLQGEPSIAGSPTLEQSTPDRSWSGPGPRTEVYQTNTVCRSLFQNHVSVQINSNTTTLLNSSNIEQASNSFDTSLTENHLAVIQESKKMACGSDIVPDVVISHPVSTIVGNKRRHALSGIERAHMEESQHGRKKNHIQDWESMRRQTLESSSSNENLCEENLRNDDYHNSVDWDAVRRASVEELAQTIKERGMHHVLSGRIKAFLKTLHEEQGSLDLEWLRKVSPENAKAYLTGIRGLGVKSVECIRLLTLHHVAFPVDVNVGRICVRLGWVPIEPLPEQLQLHLLELYPVQETIQKFLWPRLCMLDQKTLYELHYQLITFGKVFCTKSKPNCHACPMRAHCKHFASACASAKLALTGPNNEPPKRLCSGTPMPALTNTPTDIEGTTEVENVEGQFTRHPPVFEKCCSTTNSLSNCCQPYFVEEPASPEPDIEPEIGDIEDFPYFYGSLNDFTEDLLKVSELPDESMNGLSSYTHKEIDKKRDDVNSVDAGIKASTTTEGSSPNTTADQFLTLSATTSASASYSNNNSNDPSNEKFSSYESDTEEIASDVIADVDEEATNALISLPEGAHIPAPKLKNIDRLRTIHYVYELPDDHPLLEDAEIREKDDPSFYLLAIWSPVEECGSRMIALKRGIHELWHMETDPRRLKLFSCHYVDTSGEAPNSLQGIDEDCQEDLHTSSGAKADETVSGTLLIPCRTAMRGRFPLNGTYFQVNEVFADHASSLHPFQVPRSHIWRLQRRFVYFGTSVSNIFRGLTSDEIKICFTQGHVCVRGFDRKHRDPKPLVCRLHFPISKQIRQHREETEASYKN